MGQTILCKVIAEWEETKKQPNFKNYGFTSILDALKQARDVMFELGSSANRHKLENDNLKNRIKELEEQNKKLSNFLASANARMSGMVDDD